MGLFGFLKKSKSETVTAGMDLPPLPGMDDMKGFPEIRDEPLPPLPDSFLPPLPTEVPGAVPPAPQERRLETPRVELPPRLQMPTREAPEMIQQMPPAMQQQEEQPMAPTFEPEAHNEEAHAPMPEFPTVPDTRNEEFIPDTIPPLDEVPEPPNFDSREEMPKTFERPSEFLRPTMEEELIVEPEQEQMPRRKAIRGPTFIKTESIKDVVGNIDEIRAKFKEEDDMFFRITDVKGAQDQKYEEFRQTLEDIQRKLIFIDRTLFELK